MADFSPLTKQSLINGLLPNIMAGVVLGVMQIIFSISLASLIFSGPLDVHLPRAITMVLATAGISVIVTVCFSSFNQVIASIQDNPAVLIAIPIAAIASTLGVQGEGFGTILALIFVTVTLTGALLLLLGTFRLGGLMRFIPYPVIGGFMAGTGWLLTAGSISAIADYSLSLDNIPHLLQPDQLALWLPGIIFGTVLFQGTVRSHHPLVVPLLLLTGSILIFVILSLMGISIDDAMQRRLLLGDMGDAPTVWHPLPLEEISQADWSVVFAQAGSIATIVVLTSINVLLNVSSLEVVFKKDVDLNHELRITGFANLLSALAGGFIGYHGLSYSSLNRRMGADRRLPGIIVSVFCFGMLFAGTSIIAYVPRALLGGIIFFMGIGFLYEWVFQGWKRFNRQDYAVVILILAIIIVSNFLVAVGVGLLLTVIIFALNYSRANIFHHSFSGAERSSRVERAAYYRRELNRLGQHIYILELQGFIFFGTANNILDQVRVRLAASDEKSLSHLILDFRRVTGFDSSAAYSFMKVSDLARSQNFKLLLTNLTSQDRQNLLRSGLNHADHIHFFEDLDHALEWCEEEMLAASPITRVRIPSTLAMQLEDLGFQKSLTARLKPYLQMLTLAPGDYLIHQGEGLSDLYFIEIGQVSVYIELEGDKRVRVQTSSMGTIVGELGFYIDAPRSASVIADQNTIAYQLTRPQMAEMKSNDPELAVAFNEMMVRLIAERLISNNRVMAARDL